MAEDEKGVEIMGSPPNRYDYEGVERRAVPGMERRIVSDRREDACIWHGAHEQRFEADERDIAEGKTCAAKIKEELKTKVPMKLFYTLVFLVIATLGVQWRIYEKVGALALDHTEAMGTINTSIVEIKKEVAHGNALSEVARDTIKDALKQQTKATEEKMVRLQKAVDKLTP
jgi:hypothetical protein